MKLINITVLSVAVANGFTQESNNDDFEIEFPSEFDVSGFESAEIITGSDGNSTDMMARSTRTDQAKVNPSIERKKLKKYESIKKMTVYLHDSNEREWGKYCPYGCHCAVNGPTDLLAGSGHPIDEIDSACKRHKECMQCAINDFGDSSCPWWKPYKMQAMFDDVTNEKFLVCKDQTGSCKRALCECDAQFAKDIYIQRQHYTKDFHHRYGGFDAAKQCKSVSRAPGSGRIESGNTQAAGQAAGQAALQCCGSFPKRFPINLNKDQCCDGKITSLGSC